MSLRFQPVFRCLLALVLAGAPAWAYAQHGGGPGGGGGMGPGGGGVPGGMIGPGARTGMGEGGGNERHGMFESPTMRSGPRLGPPGRWWDDKHTVKSLNLRTDQQRRMDDIFEASKGGLLQQYANLQREEQRLSTMSREDLQDESKVFAAIDRIAQARAELAKANAHITMQLRRELDPAQLDALEKETAKQ
jgi:Spy/CpxP family protein refolding chaperone